MHPGSDTGRVGSDQVATPPARRTNKDDD